MKNRIGEQFKEILEEMNNVSDDLKNEDILEVMEEVADLDLLTMLVAKASTAVFGDKVNERLLFTILRSYLCTLITSKKVKVVKD